MEQTFLLDPATNTYVTRLDNGSWYNNSAECIFPAGSATANFYERMFSAIDEDDVLAEFLMATDDGEVNWDAEFTANRMIGMGG